jgi:5-formyltetrahydrofolate cyclo-ligase
MNKDEIRKKYKKLRAENTQNSQNIETNKIYDKSIVGSVNKFLLLGKYKSVGIYYPISGEPNILEIMEVGNINFSLPKITEDNNILFYSYKLGYKLAKKEGKLIYEPTNTKTSCIPEVLLIPGIAFNKYGFRIGFGSGHYDKYLSKNKNTLAVGVCYSYQITEFKNDSFDIKMNAIITEIEKN